MSEQNRAVIYALLAVGLWSTVAVAFKLTLKYLTVIELLVIASFFSLFYLAIILIVQGKLSEIWACTATEYGYSLWLGFLNPFLYYLILFEAYDILPAQQAQSINYSWGIMLAILSVPLLKQRLTLRHIIALIGGYFGVVIIASKGDLLGLNFTDPFGVFLALLSTVIWSLYWIYNARERRDPVVSLFLCFAFGCLFTLLYYLLTADLRTLPLEGILGAAYIGAFEMAFCFVIWLNALRLTNNTAQISMLIFLSPFLSLVFINFFLGEKIELATIFGLVIIIGSIIFQNFGQKTS